MYIHIINIKTFIHNILHAHVLMLTFAIEVLQCHRHMQA